MHEPTETMQDEPEKEWTDAEVNAEVNRARQIERDQMAEYFDRQAGRSFAVPAELAGEYKHEAHEPPTEAVMLAREEEENAASMDFWIHGRNPPPVQNAIDPSVPPPPSASLEEIIEATKHVPRPSHRGLFAHRYGPSHVAAIAASLAAEFPGMFAGPDVLRPVRVPPPILPDIDERARATVDRLTRESFERGITRQIAAKAHVVVDSMPTPVQPPVNEPYRYRNPPGAGRPAGSKLARKAAQGKL